MVGLYLMAGNSKQQPWNSVDKVWEGNGNTLMMPDGQEDGGNVFDGGEQPWNSVDKVWEDDRKGLMMYIRQEDGGNVFDGRRQRAAMQDIALSLKLLKGKISAGVLDR